MTKNKPFGSNRMRFSRLPTKPSVRTNEHQPTRENDPCIWPNIATLFHGLADSIFLGGPPYLKGKSTSLIAEIDPLLNKPRLGNTE